MKLYNRILAGIDFSGHAKQVMVHAVTLARELGAELVFVAVINQREIDTIHQTIDNLKNDFGQISVQRCIDRLKEERVEAMEKLKASVDLSTIKHNFIVRTGVPYQELLTAVSEEKADAVVMGVKGKSDLVDVIVGSTALKMFRRCPVPLLTVRSPKDQ